MPFAKSAVHFVRNLPCGLLLRRYDRLNKIVGGDVN